MINADFESVLMPEDNGKQNPNETYTSKYQKHVPCSCGYKLVCVGDKFREPFESYLGENAVYNFISSMVEEKRHCRTLLCAVFVLMSILMMMLIIMMILWT